MAKILMLWPDITEDIPTIIQKQYNDYVEIKNLYKRLGFFGRVVRKINSYLNLSTALFWDDWIKDIEKYDKIIIHANIINRSVPSRLRKKGYHGRIIYWYWNPVCNCVSPKKIDSNSCELWSFSKEDCARYHMRYNSTYYFMKSGTATVTPDIDLFFIGVDKGRYERLMKIKSSAEQVALKVEFRIIKDKTSRPYGEYVDRINYTELIEKVKHSKAIVELLQDGQTGFSLRVMEGLFFGKKVISDNQFLRKEPFFSEKIFYVISDNEWKKTGSEFGTCIEKFVNGEDVPVDNRWVEYFDYKNWLLRFDEED